MEIKEMTIDELEARMQAIAEEVETLESVEDIEARSTEIDSIKAELEARKSIEDKKAEIRGAVANGQGTVIKEFGKEVKTMTKAEERAEMLVKTSRASFDATEMRSVLVSSNTLVTPDAASGINDIASLGSPILEVINTVNCVGMGHDKVAYVVSEGTATSQTEGSEATGTEATFNYVDIVPSSIACKAQISKQAKKQSPLNYSAKINELALKSLRRAAATVVTAALAASDLVGSVVVATIDENSLRKIVLSCNATGNCVIAMPKASLIEFGDVRGSDKKAVYEIQPDGTNPAKGIIREGGLAVNYIIDDGLDAIYYGDFKTVQLDLFSNYEVRVSEDFAFTSLMDTIVGDCEVGADVVAKNTIIKTVASLG